MKFKFYVVAIACVVGLLLNAIIQGVKVDEAKNGIRVERNETLSYEQCAARAAALRKELETPPKTAEEYFVVLDKAYALEGSAQKAMRHPPVTWSDRTGRDFRLDDAVRSIPISFQGMLTEYAKYLGPLADKADLSEYQAALRRYEAKGHDPLKQAPVSVPGEDRVMFWWYLAHLLTIPFVFIHFVIRLREKGLKVFHEVFGNPMFPVWLFFWEIGLFRYPVDMSPME